MRRRGNQSLRTRISIRAGLAAAGLSRRIGRGRGTVVGGHAALLIDPTVLAPLTAAATGVVITGTNGKTTTTAMLRAALATRFTVASNAAGANMPAGLVAAMLSAPDSEVAVLEADEGYMREVVATVAPQVVVLLNLSREFTRGVSLSRTRTVMADALRRLDPGAAVVAGCEDPNLVDLLRDRPGVIWVRGGETWTQHHDLCPRCGVELTGGADWRCPRCALSRPAPDWDVRGDALHHGSRRYTLAGLDAAPWLTSNAAFAVAAADVLGVAPEETLAAIPGIGDVDGRYRRYRIQGRQVRVAMWKNPASLVAALNSAPDTANLVLMTDRFGIKDTVSWWDIDLPVHRSSAIVTGGRALDVAARLEADSIPVDVVASPLDAIGRCPEGEVVIVANYPALLRLKSLLSEYVVR